MSIYHILIIYIISLLCLIFDFHQVKCRKYLYIIYILFLIFSAGVKDENTSYDTYNYVIAYQSSPSIDNFLSIDAFYYEPGYAFVQSLFRTFFDSPTPFFLFIAACSIILIAVYIWRYSPFPFLSLFIYVSFFYFVREIIIIRYGLSCAIMLYAMRGLMDCRYNRFFYLSIVAFLFHYTALSAILIWLFFRFVSYKWQRILLEIFLFFSLMGYVANVSILSVIVLVSDYLPTFLSYAVNKGVRYLDSEKAYGIKQILPLLPYLYLAYKSKKNDKIIRCGYLLMLFIIIMMLQLNQAMTLARVGQMYMTIVLIFFPLLMRKFTSINLFLIYSYTMLYCMYTFVRMTFLNSGGFINVY